MRIVHTSDWHLGKSLAGHSRLAEQEKFLSFFIDKCNDLKPDLILVAGDIYDNVNPSAQAEELLYGALKKLARNGECVVLLIAGNHDNPERLTAASALAKEHGIVIVGTLKTQIATGRYGKHEIVSAADGIIEISIGEEKAVIAALPYPSEKRLAENFYDNNQSVEEKGKTYAEKIGEIFAELEKHYRKETVNIAVAHIFAMKGYEGSSERAGSLGDSFLVDRKYLPNTADYIALGHIHKPMSLDKEGKTRYSGSPIHYSIDETSYEKKFFVIDASAGEKAVISEEKIPVFKPIRRWDCKSIEDAVELCRQNSDEDSFVYINVETDRYISDAEIKEMKSLKADIIDIIPNIKEAHGELDQIKISELSFTQQFVEFYRFKKSGLEPSEEIIELFNEITTAAENADEEDVSETD